MKNQPEPYIHKKATQIPLYPGKLVIILTNSVEKLRTLYPDTPPELTQNELFAFAWEGKYKSAAAYFILLNFHDKYAKISNGVIAHEALHITNMIAKRMQIQLDPDNDEPLAYILKWITDQVHAFADLHNLKPSLKMYPKPTQTRFKPP